MDIAEDDERLWRTFPRLKLALHLLDSLNSLESIDIDVIDPFQQINGIGFGIIQPHEEIDMQRIIDNAAVPGALRRHTGNLQKLAITAEGCGSTYVTSPVQSLLSAATNLTWLELNTINFERGQEPELLQAVASLTSLRHLELSDIQAVNDSWAKINWPPLRSLLLEE